MAIGIWAQKSGDYKAFNQASIADAYAYVAPGGVVQVGPGLEATVLTGLPAVASLIRMTNTGIFGIARFHILDPTTPTKALTFDVSAITGTKTVTAPPWGSGYLLLPSTLGTSGQYLKSNGSGSAPGWASISQFNNLLDGTYHLDTVAQAVSRGSLIYGNSGAPSKWDELTIGASGTLLYSDGTDPSWRTLASFASHNDLGHRNPFTVASCTSNAVDTIVTTTTPNGFADVKVGDRIDGTLITEVIGATQWYWKTVTQVDSTTQIRTSGNKNVAGTATVTITPDQHTSALLLSGRGDTAYNYQNQPYPDAGCQLVYGSFRFLPGAPNTNMVEFKGASNPASPDGFCLRDDFANARFFFDFQNPAAGSYVLTVPFGGSQTLVGASYSQQISSKQFTAANKLQMDGTATYCVFQTAGGADRLVFDLTGLTALRAISWPDVAGTACLIAASQDLTNKTLKAGNALWMDETGAVTNGAAFRDRTTTTKGLGFDLTPITAATNRVASWPDFGGRVRLEAAAVTFADADTTPAVSGSRLFKTANTGATSITTFDNGISGQEITIIFGDGNTTLVDGATLVMAGSANKTFASTDTWTGVYDGSVWYEKCRSIN